MMDSERPGAREKERRAEGEKEGAIDGYLGRQI